MQIENIKLLEDFCEKFINNTVPYKTSKKPNLFNTDNLSLFEDTSNDNSLDITTLKMLCDDCTILTQLAKDFSLSGDIQMANLINSIQDYINDNPDFKLDNKQSKKRFLEFVYPVV